MAPPRRRAPEENTNPSNNESHSLENDISRFESHKDILKKIDSNNQNTVLGDYLMELENLNGKQDKSIVEEMEMFRIFGNIEESIDIAIQDVENIDVLIGLLKVKDDLHPTLHIPTIMIILESIKLNAQNDMKTKVIKKVKAAISNGITEMEMESIAQAMGSRYYDIYKEHRGDIDALKPKTTDFLKQLIKEKKDKADKKQEAINERKWSDETLKMIEEIDIEGSVENSEEFLAKLKKLKNTIERSKEYKKFNDAEKANIMLWLDNFENEVQATKKSGLEFMNQKFDKLAQQIDRKKDDGNIHLDLGDDMGMSFKSKQEAFDFIEEMKKEAEDDFEATWRGLSAGGILGFIFIDLPTATPKLLVTPASISNEHDAGWFLTGSLYALAALGSINYVETLFRRIVLDTAGKLVGAGEGKGVLSNLRIPDYGRSDQSFFPSNSEKEAKMRNEYLQRIEAIEKLKMYCKTLTGAKKKRSEKELQKIQSYLNVNTDTFWLKAQSLRKDHGTFIRWSRSVLGNGSPKILGGFTGKTYKNSATTYFNVNNEIETIKKGVGYLFDNVDVVVKDGQIEITGERTEKPEITRIREYINTRIDLSPKEKKRRKEMLDQFIGEMKKKGMGKEYIKSRLYNIAHEGYLSHSDVKAEIEKKIKERFPFLNDNSNLKADATFEEKWQYIKMEAKRKSTKGSPALFTSSDRMLFKFADIIEKSGWEGSREHLNEIFKKVDDGRLEISQLYKGRKIKLTTDFVTGLYNKYGLTSPELTELTRYSEGLANDKYKMMLELGEDGIKERDIIKGYIERGIDIDGERRYPIRGLRNYIEFKVDNTDEIKFRENFDELIKEIQEDKQFYNKVDIFREFDKVIKGYMTTHKVLSELNDLAGREGTSKSQKENIKKFIIQAETGLLNFTVDDITDLRKGKIVYDDAGRYISAPFTEVEQKALILEMKKIEKLDTYAFRQDIGMPKTTADAEKGLKNEYATEIKFLNIMLKMKGSSFQAEKELDKFAATMGSEGNEYTRGQATEILGKIFDGTKFEDIDIDGIVKDDSISPDTKFKVKDQMKEDLRGIYDNIKNPQKKKEMLDRIIESKVAKDDLPINIREDIDARSPEGRKLAREEAEAKSKSDVEGRKAAERNFRLSLVRTEMSPYINDSSMLAGEITDIEREIERGESIDFFHEKYKGRGFIIVSLEEIFNAKLPTNIESEIKATPKKSETPKGEETKIEMSAEKIKVEEKRIKNIFERVVLEIMLDDGLNPDQREKKLDLVDKQYSKLDTKSGLKELSGQTNAELIARYKEDDGIVNKVRTLDTIKKDIRKILELPEGTKITEYHIQEIIKAGRDRSRFSDISANIRASIDTSIQGEIKETIGKGVTR